MVAQWTEAERLIVEYTKAHDRPGCPQVYEPAAHSVIDYGRKLIEAERPKLLTAEEAVAIYYDTPGEAVDMMKAVLTEERKRTLKVIEALPKHHTQVGQYGDAVLLRDIRSVLDRS